MGKKTPLEANDPCSMYEHGNTHIYIAPISGEMLHLT